MGELDEYLAPPQRRAHLQSQDWTKRSANFILRFRRYVIEGTELPRWGVDRNYMRGYVDAVLHLRDPNTVHAAMRQLHHQHGWREYIDRALEDLFPSLYHYTEGTSAYDNFWATDEEGNPLFELTTEANVVVDDNGIIESLEGV